MTGLSAAEKEMLQKILTANGRSYSDPVYMADGVTVDMEASRRVVFKFRMKDSEMIDQMSEILESRRPTQVMRIDFSDPSVFQNREEP